MNLVVRSEEEKLFDFEGEGGEWVSTNVIQGAVEPEAGTLRWRKVATGEIPGYFSEKSMSIVGLRMPFFGKSLVGQISSFHTRTSWSITMVEYFATIRRHQNEILELEIISQGNGRNQNGDSDKKQEGRLDPKSI